MRHALSAIALMVSLGCVAPRPTPAPNEAICHVCAYNRDLACILVPKESSTPQAEYKGATYYFCSETCKAAFLKVPDKYLKPRP